MLNPCGDEAVSADHKLLRPDIINPPAIVATVDLENTTFSPLFRQAIEKALRALDENSSRFFMSLTATGTEAAPGPEKEQIPHLLTDLELTAYDGKFVGRGGLMYSDSFSYNEIPAVMPGGKLLSEDRIIFINGITTRPDRVAESMQALANIAGQPVVGIYNGTDTEFWDVIQCITDKFGLVDNKAAATLAGEMVSAAREGRSLHMLGDSQGALIISCAVGKVRADLTKEGFTEEKIDEALSRFRVETFGGASWKYPDGPQYVHYVCQQDAVTFHFGLARYGLNSKEVAELEKNVVKPGWMRALIGVMWVLDVEYFNDINPGRDGKIIRFDVEKSEDWLDSHRIETYMKFRKDFDEARAVPAESQAQFEAAVLMGKIPKWIITLGAAYGSWRMLKKACSFTMGKIRAGVQAVTGLFRRAPRCQVQVTAAAEQTVSSAICVLAESTDIGREAA